MSAARRGMAAAILIAALALAGCGNDALAEQYRDGENTGFIAADGFRVVEIPAESRGEPVAFSGVLEDGSTVGDAEYDGQVLVVNFWYAACAPCRAEAPELEAAYQAFSGQQVSFLGVNIYDGAESARSFAQTYGVSYPSALAIEDGSIKLDFAEQTPLNAVPTTLVLDTQGRVAARIIGQLQESSVLQTLIRDALEEA